MCLRRGKSCKLILQGTYSGCQQYAPFGSCEVLSVFLKSEDMDPCRDCKKDDNLACMKQSDVRPPCGWLILHRLKTAVSTCLVDSQSFKELSRLLSGSK